MLYLYIIAAAFYTFDMLITFNDGFRKSNWYLPMSITGNLFGSICWFMLVKHLDNNDRILIHSVYWDFMILLIGYMLPLMIYQFHFNFGQIIGMSMVVIGLCLLKAFH